MHNTLMPASLGTWDVLSGFAPKRLDTNPITAVPNEPQRVGSFIVFRVHRTVHLLVVVGKFVFVDFQLA